MDSRLSTIFASKVKIISCASFSDYEFHLSNSRDHIEMVVPSYKRPMTCQILASGKDGVQFRAFGSFVIKVYDHFSNLSRMILPVHSVDSSQSLTQSHMFQLSA